ncbi:MAG: DedA family protein [Thermoplasmata archaeon]|nr:DedA family protein [Thermoplasmata archaeon]
MSAFPLVETVVNAILTLLMEGGLPALIVLMAVESFGIPPIPSEVILPFAGFLVAEGHYSFAAAVLAALVGSMIGSFAAYAVGRWGRNLLTSGPSFLRLDPEQLDRMDSWFTRHGQVTVLVARLLPIVRSYISYPAGTARMEPIRFGAFTAVGATPFLAAFIYVGVLLGSRWAQILPYLQYADDAAIVVIVAGAAFLLLRWRRSRNRRTATGNIAPAP